MRSVEEKEKNSLQNVPNKRESTKRGKKRIMKKSCQLSLKKEKMIESIIIIKNESDNSKVT